MDNMMRGKDVSLNSSRRKERRKSPTPWKNADVKTLIWFDFKSIVLSEIMKISGSVHADLMKNVSFAAEREFRGRFIHYQKTFKAFFPPALTHFQGIFKGLQHLIGMKESRVVPCGKQCHPFKIILNKQTNKQTWSV